jgi:hypothetical protein
MKAGNDTPGSIAEEMKTGIYYPDKNRSAKTSLFEPYFSRYLYAHTRHKEHNACEG